MPALFAAAGEKATTRVIEFFTANIRNRNTRLAYGLAVRRFSEWCEERRLRLHELTPIHIAAYVEKLLREPPTPERKLPLAKPSVKQHLAALRMLFDYLVTGQVIAFNPATSVRGPKYVIKKARRPY